MASSDFQSLQDPKNLQISTIDKGSSRSDRCCGSLFSKIWTLISFLLSYTIIWSVISEILTLLNVYTNDPIFFGLSLPFLILPLSLASVLVYLVGIDTIFIETQSKKVKRSLYIPIWNVPIFLSLASFSDDAANRAVVSTFEAFLSGTMTFPLYIINLSFLLENMSTYRINYSINEWKSGEDISIYNLVSLCLSIFMFLKVPITFFINEGMFSGNIDNKCKAAMSVALTFGPIVLLEIIHFFPFCFAYYVDGDLHRDDLIAIIFIFNVPKLLFVAHMMKKTLTDRGFIGHMNKALVIVIVFLIFITVPLVPYLMFVYNKVQISLFEDGKYGSSAKYYWNLVIYLIVLYLGSCAYVMIVVGFDASTPVQAAIILIVFLSVFSIFTFPFGYSSMRKQGLYIR